MPDIQVDVETLYREETITDMQVASLRRMIPITIDGADDPKRSAFFVASTTIMTGAGPMPVNAEIEAKTIREAVEKFPKAIEDAITEMINRAREYQRDQASRIVVPDAGTASKIQLA